MTEDELRSQICRIAGRADTGGQVPFSNVAIPLHPDQPIDYESVRTEMFEAALGPSDAILHPPIGAPHIDVLRFPPTAERPFWAYATNGMSDFAQVLPDGTSFRSELTCFTRAEDSLWADLLVTLGTFPFRCNTFLHLHHTVPFPDGVGDHRFPCTLTIPPFLAPGLFDARFLGGPLLVISVIRITAQERDYAVAHSSRALVDALPDALDTWLVDGRRPGPQTR